VAGYRPSATFLFESVAAAFGTEVLAIIVTGMGEDGVAGLHKVKKEGGLIWAQNEESSVVFGMPARAIEAGLAETVLPLESIALRMLGTLGLYE
jgi:two-component system, chemotaxis family, protein-glutamate methylesterase/glutaminase